MVSRTASNTVLVVDAASASMISKIVLARPRQTAAVLAPFERKEFVPKINYREVPKDNAAR